MKDKELLEMIVSLEEHLGLRYSPKDAELKDSYSSHQSECYGLLKQHEESIEKLDKKVFPKKRKRTYPWD